MAVHVRLSRQGAKRAPFYRVVVADSRAPRDGRFIEHIGVYDPLHKPARIQIDEVRLAHWLKVGAKTSQTVGELVKAARKAQPTPVGA